MPGSNPIEVWVSRQSDGSTYHLRPRSRKRIEASYPHAHTVPSIFVGYETRSDFETHHGPMWKQLVLLLTGLNTEQLEALGGFKLYDPTTETTFFESRAA